MTARVTARLPVAGLPRLNEQEPNFTAPTTRGMESLSDYRGKWRILFSHRADFTPVCTTDFTGFARRADAFAKFDSEFPGLSIDSQYVHIAWVRTIKATFGDDLPFPIIADLAMEVAQGFGMIQPGASDPQAVHATLVIDPEGVLRVVVHCPLTDGRSVDETVRLVEALQPSEAHKVATPENWHPGEDVIFPTPKTTVAAEARMSQGFDTTDWHFSTSPL